MICILCHRSRFVSPITFTETVVMCQALSWEAETRKCMILIDDTTYSNVKDVLLMEDAGVFTSSLFGNDIKIRGYRFPVKDKTRHHRRMSHAGGLNVRDNLVAEELMDTQMTRYWDLKAFVRVLSAKRENFNHLPCQLYTQITRIYSYHHKRTVANQRSNTLNYDNV